MEKPRYCAYVRSNGTELDRNSVKAEFSKFGKITKLFVDPEKTVAKVYFDNIEELRRACQQLHKKTNWLIEFRQDQYNNNSRVHGKNCSNIPISDTNSIHSSNNMDSEEECEILEDYVNGQGKPVTVLRADNGQLFVDLNDIRSSGFTIFRKEDYKTTILTRIDDLKEFESYLLNQAVKYLITMKRSFETDEIFETIEKVKLRLWGPQRPEQNNANNRTIDNTASSSKNITITAKNNPTTNIIRPPRTLPQNYVPSVNRVTQAKTETQNMNRNNNMSNGSKQSTGLKHEGKYKGFVEVKATTPKSFYKSHGKSSENHNLKPVASKNVENDEENWLSNEEQPVDLNMSNINKKEVMLKGQPETSSGHDKKQSDNADVSEKIKLPSRLTSASSINKNDKEVTLKDQHQTSGGHGKKQLDESVSEKSELPAIVDMKPSSTNNIDQNVTLKGQPETASGNEKKQSDNPSVSEKIKLPISRLTLPLSSESCTVCISYIKSINSKLYYVQLAANTDIVQDLLLQVNYVAETQNVVSPIPGGLYLVQFEELWYRGMVINVHNDQSLFVELIDYGNKETITAPVKELPEELKSIPAQSIRIVFPNEQQLPEYQIETQLDIIAKKQYEDGTYLVQLSTESSTLSPISKNDSQHDSTPSTPIQSTSKLEPSKVAEEAYFTMPPPLRPLKNDEKVLILGIEDDRLILRTKECAAKCKDIYNLISKIDKQPITNVKEGQLVLCSRDGLEGLHRAVVTKIENSEAHLEYLDYVGKEKLSVKSLRNVNAELATAPRTVVESPPYAPLKDITGSIDYYICDLVATKKKLDVVLQDGSFDLRMDSTTLSQKIKELRRMDKPVKEVVSEDEPINYEEMPFVKLELGSGSYFCYSCRDSENITLLSSEPEYQQYLDDIEITITDTTPYEPEVFQMCCAKFEDQWYRAAILEVNENKFKVLFVDFGNICHLTKNDLRKLPKKYKTIPILGVSSYFIGLPKNDSSLNKRLGELIYDGIFLEVIIKTELDPDTQQYGIEIPEIYKKLESEGFI